MSLHIDTQGQGPDLILLHGWAMHSGIFAPLLAKLTAHFRVHCVDLPGHGQSRHSALPLAFEPFWQSLLSRLDGPAFFMGWSLGGLFALYGAQKFPQHCHGLIMQNASPCFVHQSDWPHGMPAEVFQQFAADLNTDYAQTLHRFFMLEAQGSDTLRSDLRLLQKTAFSFGEPDSRILCEGLGLLQHTDLRDGLNALQMPSLWLAGRRDRLVNPQAMLQASQLCNGRFQCAEHGGHAPFLTHAADIAEWLVEFAGAYEPL